MTIPLLPPLKPLPIKDRISALFPARAGMNRSSTNKICSNKLL